MLKYIKKLARIIVSKLLGLISDIIEHLYLVYFFRENITVFIMSQSLHNKNV